MVPLGCKVLWWRRRKALSIGTIPINNGKFLADIRKEKPSPLKEFSCSRQYQLDEAVQTEQDVIFYVSTAVGPGAPRALLRVLHPELSARREALFSWSSTTGEFIRRFKMGSKVTDVFPSKLIFFNFVVRYSYSNECFGVLRNFIGANNLLLELMSLFIRIS